jgi:hypothetical protein
MMDIEKIEIALRENSYDIKFVFRTIKNCICNFKMKLIVYEFKGSCWMRLGKLKGGNGMKYC